MDEIVGGELTANVNDVLTKEPPSETVIVTVAVPLAPAAGVRVTFRFAPDPPNEMLAFGNSVAFDELPVSVRMLSGVSTSLMVKLAVTGTPTVVV